MAASGSDEEILKEWDILNKSTGERFDVATSDTESIEILDKETWDDSSLSSDDEMITCSLSDTKGQISNITTIMMTSGSSDTDVHDGLKHKNGTSTGSSSDEDTGVDRGESDHKVENIANADNALVFMNNTKKTTWKWWNQNALTYLLGFILIETLIVCCFLLYSRKQILEQKNKYKPNDTLILEALDLIYSDKTHLFDATNDVFESIRDIQRVENNSYSIQIHDIMNEDSSCKMGAYKIGNRCYKRITVPLSDEHFRFAVLKFSHYLREYTKKMEKLHYDLKHMFLSSLHDQVVHFDEELLNQKLNILDSESEKQIKVDKLETPVINSAKLKDLVYRKGDMRKRGVNMNWKKNEVSRENDADMNYCEFCSGKSCKQTCSVNQKSGKGNNEGYATDIETEDEIDIEAGDQIEEIDAASGVESKDLGNNNMKFKIIGDVSEKFAEAANKYEMVDKINNRKFKKSGLDESKLKGVSGEWFSKMADGREKLRKTSGDTGSWFFDMSKAREQLRRKYEDVKQTSGIWMFKLFEARSKLRRQMKKYFDKSWVEDKKRQVKDYYSKVQNMVFGPEEDHKQEDKSCEDKKHQVKAEDKSQDSDKFPEQDGKSGMEDEKRKVKEEDKFWIEDKNQQMKEEDNSWIEDKKQQVKDFYSKAQNMIFSQDQNGATNKKYKQKDDKSWIEDKKSQVKNLYSKVKNMMFSSDQSGSINGKYKQDEDQSWMEDKKLQVKDFWNRVFNVDYKSGSKNEQKDKSWIEDIFSTTNILFNLLAIFLLVLICF